MSLYMVFLQLMFDLDKKKEIYMAQRGENR